MGLGHDADYLDRLENTLSVNAAIKIGHSALRRVVLGTNANRRGATRDEIDRMRAHLRAGLEAGAIGFSSSWSSAHNDTERNIGAEPVPHAMN